MAEMTEEEYERNLIEIEEIEEKVENLKTLLNGVFEEEEITDEIFELQKEIESKIEDMISDFNMDYAGDSGLHYGYGWTTTEEGVEYPLDIYTKYTNLGLVDVIISK